MKHFSEALVICVLIVCVTTCTMHERHQDFLEKQLKLQSK